MVPLLPMSASADEGSSEQWLGTVRGSVRVPLLPATDPWQPWAGLTIGATYMESLGRASDGFTSQRGAAMLGGGGIELGVRWAPTPWLRVGVDGLAGLVLPRTAIRFAGVERGRLGPFWLEAALFVGIAP